jgi:hypothetical protein
MEDFMKTNLLIWTTFLVLLASAAFCDTYKWEDKNGVHFTDNLESIPKKYKSKSIAEAREDIKGVSTPEIDATSTSNSKQNKRTPTLINRPNTDKTHNKQAQPSRLDKENGGIKIRAPRHRHQKSYGNQTHGVEEAQRSAYENQTPARKAMNQAEERIRQNRQALDAGGSLPPKQKQQLYRGTPP